MDTRTTILTIAVTVLLVIIVLATLFLPRKTRLALYAGLIGTAALVLAYVTFNTRFLPSQVALEPYAEGLDQPVFALMPPDNSGRFLILERAGKIRILQDGTLLEQPFLDVTDKVDIKGLEQGLLSMVFHPDYGQNRFFYIFYTGIDGRVKLVRYQVSAGDANLADAESATILFEVDHPGSHHNGGHLLFGPDGYLYVTIGDNLSPRAEHASQDRSNLLGDMLRLDVSDPAGEPPYQIPPDNPFVNEADARPEIWAYGLRNPWRYDFDPVTGDLYLTDVGDLGREEVNYIAAGQGAGSNFGWRWYEGSRLVEDMPGEAPSAEELVFPAAEYDHLALGGCAIVGGYVYRGEAMPDLAGKYIYGDYCSGFLWSLERTQSGDFETERIFRTTELQLSSFAEDRAGELYLLDLIRGTMSKLVAK